MNLMPEWAIKRVDIFHISYDSCVNNYNCDDLKIWGYIRHIERAQNVYVYYIFFKKGNEKQQPQEHTGGSLNLSSRKAGFV